MLLYDSLTDNELAILLKSDDAAAYTVIYHRYFDVLYLHVLQKLKDTDDAQDVIHELFAQLWNKRQTLEISTSLAAYLHTAARNRVFDFISHQQVQSKYITSLQGYLNTGYCITDHLVREKQFAEFIEKGISNLPEKMRVVFELSRKEKLSHKEIAAKLNLSEETVKKQIKNALKILRIKLGAMLFVSF